MTKEELARHIAFVVRCSGAATLSYMLAHAIGLPHPVWASMSGVIVSQEKLNDTHTATAGRVFGTVIGVAVAVVVGSLLQPLHADVAVQMAVAVALAAVIARRYPLVRVCMWTCPLVFLESDPNTPMLVVGFQRGTEVLLGGAVGAALHALSEAVIGRLVPHEAAPEGEGLQGQKTLHDD